MGKRKTSKSRNKSKLIGTIIAIIFITICGIAGVNYDVINTSNADTSTNSTNSTNNNTNINQIENKTELEGKLQIYYFDVGQADSILLINNEKTMLIDAGTNETGGTVVKNLQSLNIKKIDYLIGTHPHEDHIGGLDDVINNFDIGEIYMPKIQNNTKTFEDVLDAVANKNLQITSPEVGFKFMVGSAECEVMLCGSGTEEEKANLNLSSLVIRTTYGKQSYLFMGDAETENENSRQWEQTNVLKVGHHGSTTSSSTKFLTQIKPQIAIIQVGKDNSYGHPKQTILDRLNKLGTTIYRTDQDGNILIVSDGIENQVSLNVWIN